MSQQNQNPPYPEPPKPPGFKPAFKLYPYQYIAIPLIFLIPILALLGVFGETMGETTAASADLALRIEYPERLRYKMQQPIEVALTNETDSAIGELRVRFEKQLIDAFTNVTFMPQPESITDEYYEVVLEDVQPDETRFVNVSVQANAITRTKGKLRHRRTALNPSPKPLPSLSFRRGVAWKQSFALRLSTSSSIQGCGF